VFYKFFSGVHKCQHNHNIIPTQYQHHNHCSQHHNHMNHIQYLREICGKPLQVIRDKYRKDQLYVNIIKTKKQYAYIKEISEEVIKLCGEYRIVRRIFVEANDTKRYVGVGWIISDDMDICMMCLEPFSSIFFSHKSNKHHCRACGIIICNKCSQNNCIVDEIIKLGPVIVCHFCNYGQAVVHITPTERNEKVNYVAEIPSIAPVYSSKYLLCID